MSALNMTTALQVQKSVFVVFFSGERAKSKILKICEAFGANRYPFPEDLSKQAQMITEVHRILDIYKIEFNQIRTLII